MNVLQPEKKTGTFAEATIGPPILAGPTVQPQVNAKVTQNGKLPTLPAPGVESFTNPKEDLDNCCTEIWV